ncbi:protease modulator HflC [Pseudobacteriovorax antillogorgiicola]|uniref:Protein HflC n=1 Tax=Pseudobacteriovorax antillogorgiicola TaxID=1513793 RepID=A0A1Y6BI87_9BACT|nr:protease modulator HflC [Pseudobacteriovorax antillogorgiicola]TCS55503.1 protease FtsH subunit HflC [Pseudobacteriovorax antillogorgiicola]SMF11569.1 protease FtsH subunit HflC [Pseudobacteriovorax antillogorgiicola]
MSGKVGFIAAAIVAVVALINSSVYIVNEAQQAIITQFGQIMGKPVTDAGIHFKAPFIQNVSYFDKRILHWDGDPAQVPTKDKKFILVDTTARWRIKDPETFFKAVKNIRLALQRITGILDGKTKNVISNYNLVEAVRNTNDIIEKVKQNDETTDEKVTGEIEPVTAGREKLSQQITAQAQIELDSLGIELVDVLITRIAYVQEVEDKVFDRMISERNRIAEKTRSVGKGEEAKILGQMNLDLKEIESDAYRQSQEIMGKADAEAIAIYAESLRGNAEFYEFMRTMDAYKKTLPKSNLVIGTDSEFLKLLDRN